MKPAVLRLLLSLSVCLTAAGCGRDAAAPPEGSAGQSVRLALNWYPEAEHGGYIAADVHQLYSRQQLDVEIIPGGPGAPQLVIAELAAGRVQFAVSDADNVVKARASGVPLVALLAPLQNSPRCIMVHAASGIQQLDQLANVELAISESRPFALWMKKKLPLQGVTMVPYSGSVGEFLTKPQFAQQAYVFSEPFVAREQGGDPHVLLVSDLGFNPYASLLVTTEDIIRDDPDLVRRMVQAAALGWQQYLEDGSHTNAAIHAQNGDMSLAVLEFGVQQLQPLCRTENNLPPGSMTLERWQLLIRQIEEIGEIPAGSVDASKCFTTQFLPSAVSQ